jgi:hypothetical protein
MDRCRFSLKVGIFFELNYRNQNRTYRSRLHGSQVFRLKLFAQANRTTRDHEDALAPVMLWFPLAIQQPKSAGENSNIMCHPIVIMLVVPFDAELTSNTGPGSK